MKNNIFIYVFLLLSSISVLGQIEIKGQLTNTVDIEGIQVLNETSGFKTVVDEDGKFLLKANTYDVILFSAVNYYTFKYVVSRTNYDKKKMEVTLVLIVNELDEVNLTKKEVDVNSDELAKSVAISYPDLMFHHKPSFNMNTGIDGNVADNAYHNGQTQNGLDLIGGVKLLRYVLFGKPDKDKTAADLEREREMIENGLKNRFVDTFLTDTYGIPEKATADFIYYVQESGIPPAYLEPENELLLLDYILNKSKEYLREVEK